MKNIEKAKILVVDDEHEIRELLLRILRLKYQVDSAEDGVDALKKTAQEHFDLMIVDLKMPQMSGQELVKAMRERGDKQISFIILTGHGNLDEAYQLLSEVKISDFLNKPIRRQELLFSVERALRECALVNQLKDYNDNLEADVVHRTKLLNERNVDLLKAKEQVEAASNAKTAFLSRMTHELRTPLNAIIGFGQLQSLMEPSSPNFYKDLKENNQEILGAGQHLLTLVDDLIDFATNIENRPICIESVSLDKIISASIHSIKSFAEAAQVSIEYQPSLKKVLADQSRLKQIMDKLLSNAVKFNHSPGSIYIKVNTGAEQVKITIRDTGVGISSADENAIFEPFTRTGYAEKQEIPGTGIGLSLCQSLINQMKGSITFKSEKDGSSFLLSLRTG